MPRGQTKNNSTAPEAVSKFKKIPGEIRNMIYSRCRSSLVINIMHARNRDGFGVFTGLATVFPDCEQETLDYYYVNNTFMFDVRMTRRDSKSRANEPLQLWRSWLSNLGDRTAGLLRRLRFYTTCFSVDITIPESLASRTQSKIECSIRFTENALDACLMDSYRQTEERSRLKNTLEGVWLAREGDCLTMAEIDQIRMEVLPLLLRCKVWAFDKDLVEQLAQTPVINFRQEAPSQAKTNTTLATRLREYMAAAKSSVAAPQ